MGSRMFKPNIDEYIWPRLMHVKDTREQILWQIVDEMPQNADLYCCPANQELQCRHVLFTPFSGTYNR